MGQIEASCSETPRKQGFIRSKRVSFTHEWYSDDPIADLPEFLHKDVRYAVFYATMKGSKVHVNHVVLTTGKDFFTPFRRFGGLVANKKLQIPLPRDFFS